MQRDQHIPAIQRDDHRKFLIAFDGKHLRGMYPVAVSEPARFIISVMSPHDPQANVVREIHRRQISGNSLTKVVAGSFF